VEGAACSVAEGAEPDLRWKQRGVLQKDQRAVLRGRAAAAAAVGEALGLL